MNRKTKLEFGFGLMQVMIVCAIIALMAVVCAERAQAQGDQQGQALYTDDFLGTNTIAVTATSSNLITGGVAKAIRLRQGRGLAIWPYYNGTASTNTGNVGFQLFLSWQPTNNGLYTTTKPLTFTSTANGTTAVLDWYYWPPTTLNGALWAKVGIVTQAVANIGNSANLTITNIWGTFPNPSQ